MSLFTKSQRDAIVDKAIDKVINTTVIYETTSVSQALNNYMDMIQGKLKSPHYSISIPTILTSDLNFLLDNPEDFSEYMDSINTEELDSYLSRERIYASAGIMFQLSSYLLQNSTNSMQCDNVYNVLLEQVFEYSLTYKKFAPLEDPYSDVFKFLPYVSDSDNNVVLNLLLNGRFCSSHIINHENVILNVFRGFSTARYPDKIIEYFATVDLTLLSDHIQASVYEFLYTKTHSELIPTPYVLLRHLGVTFEDILRDSKNRSAVIPSESFPEL